MEAFFAPISGGYVDLIVNRGIGFPVVHLESDFSSPLRYGDVFTVRVSVKRVGSKSCTFCYEFRNGTTKIAQVEQIVVATNLTSLASVNLPDDVRALLEKHLEP